MTKTIQSPWGTFPLETERLILRPPLTDDLVDELIAAKKETWEQLQKWMPWAKGKVPCIEQDLAMLKEQEVKFYAGEDCMLFGFEKDTSRLSVFTGLHRPDWENRVFEIGYWTRRLAQGKGYAQEATKFLISHAFNELNASAVVIAHAIGNEPSRAIIEKCGFAFTHEAVDENDGRLSRYYAIKPA